jgi:hypothetical protein
LINEVMLSPLAGDGSIYGTGPGFSVGDNEGEWIELYNPNQCEPVDISCYFLGNNTNDGSTYGGGFSIPQGTIVPAQFRCSSWDSGSGGATCIAGSKWGYNNRNCC